MKILIACEYSGVVRDEFIKLGHQAVSCDLLPSESTLGPHYQGDVLDILYDGGQIMAEETVTITKAEYDELKEDSQGTL